MMRYRVACDRCGFGAWIGLRGDVAQAWCESCQTPAEIPAARGAGPPAPRCAACGESLTLDAPRFEELWGEVQNLAAVLEAWEGDVARIGPLVPERPRFLTDLAPPPPSPSDPPGVRAALEALGAGSFRAAREKLDAVPLEDDRHWFALGVACHRLGDWAGAEVAYSRVLERAPGHREARLDRGVLRAQRGDSRGAREDLEQAGDGYEARWNLAALIVHQSLAAAPAGALPEPGALRTARDLADSPSSYWSDPTVGRLLFTLVAERAMARRGDMGPDPADARTLRAAEAEVEFDTFTDRAMVLRAYAALGMRGEAEAVARPLALRVIETLRREPFFRGPQGRGLDRALEQVALAASQGRSAGARAAAAELLGRSDLARYRVPCARCEHGTIGVEQLEDEPVPGDEPAARP